MKKLMTCFLILSLLLVFSGCAASNSDPHSGSNSPFPSQGSTNKNPPPTVDFETNGGSYIKSQQTKTITSLPYTEKENCLFDGWYLDENFSSAASFPLTVEKNTTLYAKWLDLQSSTFCESGSIKWGKGHSSSITYYVTPSGFDLEKLASKGYHMKITVSYDVHYRKDYDVLWDIGYAGSPKYEAYLLNSDGLGDINENMSTATNSITRSLVYSSSVADLKNQRLTLTFSTNNIQNIIYFSNIVIQYQCYK